MRPSAPPSPRTPLFGHTRDEIVGALRLLMQAGADASALRRDVDPEDVFRAMGAVWQRPIGPGWQDQVLRLLDLLVDGLRYGAVSSKAWR